MSSLGDVVLAPEVSPSPTHVDPAVLQRLSEDLGDAETVAEMVRDTAAGLGARLATGAAAALRGDEEASRREAHSLCSVARLLGASRLADGAAAIEHTGAPWEVVAESADATRREWTLWVASVAAPAAARPTHQQSIA